MNNDTIADHDFGSKEWEAWWVQRHKEEQFEEIMTLVSDALLISVERDMFSINAILSVAIQKLKALGIACDINGQKRLEIKND